MGIRRHKSQRGFALILVLGVLLVAASVAMTMVSRQENDIVWNPVLGTKDQLDTVQKALIAYQRENHSLPLPAPRSGNGTPHQQARYELAGTNSTGVPTKVLEEFHSGADSVLMDSGVRYVESPTGDIIAIGALPTDDLGLPRRAAEDAQGKFLTYAVTFAATDPAQFATADGVIDTVDAAGAPVAQDQTFLVLSHGEDSKGGWSVKSRNAVSARDCTGDIANKSGGTVNGNTPIDTDNCDESDTQFVVNDLNLVAGGGYFDDQLLDGETDERATNQNLPCAPQRITWGPGNACGADVPQLFDESTNAAPTSVALTSDTTATGDATVECSEGVLSILTTPAPTCTPPVVDCTTPWGDTVAHGDSVTSYSTGPCVVTASCAIGNSTCNNGSWDTAPFANENGCTDHCAGCLGQSVMWNVTGNICNANLPFSVYVNKEMAIDSAGPLTGQRQYTCLGDGTWSPDDAGTCSTPTAPCAETTLTWTIGANTCSETVKAGVHGDTITANDTTAPTTGSRGYECDDGSWDATSSGTCVTSYADCALPWGGTIAHGNSVTAWPALNCLTKPACSSETRTCNDGVLSGSYTNQNNCTEHCASNAPCTATTLSWTVGGNSCTGDTKDASHGASTAVSDTTAPNTGSRTYTCDDGTWTGSGTGTCSSGTASCALPWGGTLAHGASVQAYSTSSVTCGNSCPASTTRTCNNGTLSGSGDHANCTVGSCSACGVLSVNWTVGGDSCNGTLSGAAHGAAGSANDTTVPTTGSRGYECNNGTWSPTEAGSCSTLSGCAATSHSWSVGGNNCTGSVTSATHGQSRIANDSGAPTTGAANYACSNGTWNASGAQTCEVNCAGGAVSWTVGGQTCNGTVSAATEGQSRTATDSTAPTTGSRNFTCNSGGGWTGVGTGSCTTSTAPCSATSRTWSVGGDSCTGPLTAASHGDTRTATDSTAPTTGSRNYTCLNGSWSGSGTGSCTSPSDCTTPWGATVAHGASVQAYSNDSVSCGNSCPAPTTRFCNNGTLSGSGNFASCAVDACNSCSSVSRTWSVGGETCTGTLSVAPHGQSRTATDSSGSVTGARNYSCNDGLWSGVGTGTCNGPSDCALPWGGTIAHGASVQAYSTDSVSCGNSCPAPTSRLCNNGTLLGSGNHASCSVDACSNCNLPWGGTLAHGNTVQAYSTSSVSCGNSCPSSTTRSCNNGALSGSGNFASCSVGACSGCTGRSETWTVSGDTCTGPLSAASHGQSRTVIDNTGSTTGSRGFNCSNGVWSPQGPGACSGPSDCTAPWGATVAHGASVIAYQNPTYGNTMADCSGGLSQMRTCSDGTLSGTYQYQSQTRLSCLDNCGECHHNGDLWTDFGACPRHNRRCDDGVVVDLGAPFGDCVGVTSCF